eukprot:3066519-Amphidinium_carterae.1
MLQIRAQHCCTDQGSDLVRAEHDSIRCLVLSIQEQGDIKPPPMTPGGYGVENKHAPTAAHEQPADYSPDGATPQCVKGSHFSSEWVTPATHWRRSA